MAKVLIVGSKGFIGSRVLRYFQQQGFESWGADVVVDYDQKEYLLVDASNSEFRSFFENHDFQICINCSGAANVPDSLTNPSRDFYLNTVNVFKLLDAIRTQRPSCKFINLSSAAVYGSPRELPISEQSRVLPVSPYGFHKLISEQICEEFSRFYQIQTCSIRIFSAYGEGLKKQLFWDLHQKSKLTGSVQLFGTGDESRDFIHIHDVCRAIFLIALNGDYGGKAINVASGIEVFVKDAVKLFYELLETKTDYNFSGAGRRGDPNNWVADITHLTKLGFKPSVSLREGLSNYIQWLKEERSR